MKRSDSKMRNLASHILAAEAGGLPSDIKCAAPFLVCEKLRPHLSVLMGAGGFRALLSRALALAAIEAPWLRAVHVKADGSLAGLDDLAQASSKETTEGCIALIAQLLGLLVAFIGENLTRQLVAEVWPKLSFNDLDLVKGRKK